MDETCLAMDFVAAQQAVMGQMGSLVEAANRIEIPMKIESR